jgi:hypothetical protein
MVPFDRSSSTFNRLEAINAISIPEKKAEAISERIIAVINKEGSI